MNLSRIGTVRSEASLAKPRDPDSNGTRTLLPSEFRDSFRMLTGIGLNMLPRSSISVDLHFNHDYDSDHKYYDSLASMPTPVLGLYRGRGTSRRSTRRLIHKDGVCNVSHVNVPKQRRKYIVDLFTTVVDIKWRWSLLMFAAAFLCSWTLFAGLYYAALARRGDFNQGAELRKNQPCIYNIRNQSFTSVFLFSVETQHTIGYGNRYISEDCSEVIFLLCLQSIIGVMIQSFMAGIVFAKIARPKKRGKTLIFSRQAVINMRDGKLCFMFRVGDMRTSHLVEAHVRVQMIKKRITAEGEILPFHQFDMNVGYEDGMDRIFLVWPLTICHVIDSASPLYEYSAKQLASARFEVVVILEGIVESTGMTTQARTSYIPSEILWGHRFEKLVTYQRDNGEYRIDYAQFHQTKSTDTPSLSAKDLDQRSSNSSREFMNDLHSEKSQENFNNFNVSLGELSTMSALNMETQDGYSTGRPSSPPLTNPQTKLMQNIRNKWLKNRNNSTGNASTLRPEIVVQSPSLSSVNNGIVCNGKPNNNLRCSDDNDDDDELSEVVVSTA